MINSLSACWDKVWERKVSAVPLGVLRILFAFTLMLEILHFFYFRHLLFDPVPYLEPSKLDAVPLLFFWGLAVLCIGTGYKTRMAAIVNYIFCVSILGFSAISKGFEWHADSIILTVSFFLLFMPSDESLSLHRVLQRGRQEREGETEIAETPRVRSFYYVLLILLLGSIYLDSIFWKLSSSIYLSGLALWAPASVPFATYLDLTFLVEQKYLVIFGCYFALIYESVFLFIVWPRLTRTLVVFTGIFFHICITLVFPLPAFSLVMIAVYSGIISPGFYRKIGKFFAASHPRCTIFYSDAAADQRYLKGITESLDIFKRIEWKKYSSSDMMDTDEVTGDKILVTFGTKNSMHRREDGIRYILKAIGWTYPFAWLLKLNRLHKIFEAGLSWAGKKAVTKTEGAPTAGRVMEWALVDQLKRGAAVLFLGFWLLSFVIILFASPFIKTYFPVQEETAQELEDYAYIYKMMVYPWTGFSTHGIYVDGHFEGYDYQIMLTNNDKPLPLINRNGRATGYNIGRNHIIWAYRATVPSLRVAEMEKNIARFVAFWAFEQEIKIEDLDVRIWSRPLEFSNSNYVPGMLKQNVHAGWEEVGHITWNGFEIDFNWNKEDFRKSYNIVTAGDL